MTYRGKVANGVVVLENPKALPEGSPVEVRLAQDTTKEMPIENSEIADLRETMLRWAGRAKGLPSDLARNHDHYLHGRSKK